MTRVYKSLEEVWEMKESAWKDFKDSGYDNYVNYINNAVKDFKAKNNIKNRNDVEKQ